MQMLRVGRRQEDARKMMAEPQDQSTSQRDASGAANRREYPRIDVRLRVDVHKDAVVHECQTSNVSWGGLALVELAEPVKVGDDVELGLAAESPMVHAHVCWRRGDEVGVRFAPEGKVERNCVRAWVQSALKDQA